MKTYDMRPRTIFDIGVAYGTPDLYKEFPEAKYFLIDPLRESLPHMQKIAEKLNAEIHNVALGEAEADLEIHVHENIGGSTVYPEQGVPGSPEIARYSVPVQRLDSLVSDFDRPALCKIDVQGAELSVLKGMSSILSSIDVFIVEVNTIETLKGAPLLADIVAYMDSHDFVVYELMMIGRRPLDEATSQLDLAFVHKESQFLANKKWGTH